MDQQPIMPPTMSTSQTSKSNKTLILIIGAIILILGLAGFFWWFSLSKSNQTPATTTQQNNQVAGISTTSNVVSSSTVSITYVQKLATPIKTIPAEVLGGSVQVFLVGTINEGVYVGKKIALAKLIFPNPERNRVTYNYLYYIADSTGGVVAWDPNFLHDQGYYGEVGEYSKNMADYVGLSEGSKRSINILPAELGNSGNIQTSDHKAIFALSQTGIFNTDNYPNVTPLAMSDSGFPILKHTNQSTGILLPPTVDYFVQLPFGLAVRVSPEPDFVDQNDVPQLTWINEMKPVASYRYGQYAYGWEDCYDGISDSQFRATLVVTGTTVKGESVYEVSVMKYPKVYECLHEKTKRYIYDDRTQTGSYVDTVSFEDFMVSHPMFFWKHPTGEYVAFVRSDVVPAAEKAKPVVYLYPQKTEKVYVSVNPIGGFIKTDPEYGNGWTVIATPEGVLTNSKDGKQYPYLFWEGGKDGVVQTPKEGFVVEKNNVATVLAGKLSAFGLNTQEQKDFLDFWGPKLSTAPYYFITFISRSEIDRVSPMTISPKPDTVIRVLMDYKPLTSPIQVDPLEIISTPRNGFTVVEWGGIVR